MKYFLIMNPGSRDGKSKKNFDEIFSHLKEHKIDFSHAFTTSLDDAYSKSITANKDGFDVIVAVGGDGTINKVLNGFYDTGGQRISKARFGIIYTGTSPDICKENNIPFHDIKASINTLIKGQVKQIQIGEIKLHKELNAELDSKHIGNSNNTVTKYFIAAANIGIGAQVARYAGSGIRKYLGDVLGTFLSLIRTFVTFKPYDYTVRLDGKERKIHRVFNMCIGKSYYIASGMTVYNELKSGDKRFYNVMIKNFRFRNIASIMNAVYSGKKIENNHLFSFSYHNDIEVYGNNLSPEIEFDGDPAGFLPCRIRTAADPIDIIVKDK